MGEGGVRERSDGRWEARYVDARGVRRSVYGATEDEAKRELRRALNERDKGVSGSAESVGAWLEGWLDRLDLAPTTVSNYRYYVGLVPDWFLRIRLTDRELTPAKVARMLDEIAAVPTEYGNCDGQGPCGHDPEVHQRAPKTVLEVRMVLRRALKQAQRWGHLARNAAALVDPPDVPEADISPLTIGEARALLSEVSGHRLESLYTVALTHGLRESEAIGALLDNLDLEQRTLTVDTQLPRDGRRRKPKGGVKSRTIALTATGVRQLRAHRVRLAEERLSLGEAWTEHGLVWPSSVGTPLGHRALLRHLHQTCEKAGIRRISFHTLRHSAATLMLAQGVPERVIMEILGHSTTSMMRRYTKVVDELVEDAADAMDAALSPAMGSDVGSDDASDAEIRELRGGGDGT